MDRGHHKTGCPRYHVGLSILIILCQILSITGEKHQGRSLGDDYFLPPCLLDTDESCSDKGIKFSLFTRKNPSDAHQVFVNVISSNPDDTSFDAKNPTKIIIHGFHSNMQTKPLVDIKNEYLEKEPSNVIFMDWQRLIDGNYSTAVGHVPDAGDCFIQLIQRLRNHNVADIYVTTFGLGAQVHAFAVKALSIIDEKLPGHSIDDDNFLPSCPFDAYESCPDKDINFFLFTRQNPFDAHQVFVNETGSNLNDTYFDAKNPTKIIIHGFHSSMQTKPLVDVRNEYLTKEPINVIAVDWKRLVDGNYLTAVGNVPHAGDCLAQLIKRLRDHKAADIHVIAFSLGAHVPAFAANILSPYKINRITGLDPAGPMFITVDEKHRLDAGDAEFVDVIHTDSSLLGIPKVIGHIDFFPNGGVIQPGCWNSTVEPDRVRCSHHRAEVYFAESINSKVGFWGWYCSSYVAYLVNFCPPRLPAVRMGDDVDKNHRGFHIAKTEAVAPFAEWPFSDVGSFLPM